jgi:CheY-like chemotaxis protein
VAGCAYTLENLLTMTADLILLDEWVNKKEGQMLCKEIKTIKKLAQIPVIIFSTAMNIAEIASNCRANGYVHKPLTWMCWSPRYASSSRSKNMQRFNFI